MKLIYRLIRPYWHLCAAAVLAVVLDVAGALLVPTFAAQMMNLGIAGENTGLILQKGIIMLAVAIAAGLSALAGSWFCARLSARVGRDLREQLYHKTLTLSAGDFERFGTASMMTRSMSDINNIQQMIIMFIQMILPVPVMCVLGVIFSLRIHKSLGLFLVGAMIVLMAVMAFIVRNAAPIMKKVQKAMDKMNIVLRENITGVRVIRAFNQEAYETGRMGKSFSDYADNAIRVNRMFAALDSISNMLVNFAVVGIYYFGGNAAGRGEMQIGGISAVIEYAMWILFYLIMAQFVLLMFPRAMVGVERISEVLSCEPEIRDGADSLAAEASSSDYEVPGNGAAGSDERTSAGNGISGNKEVIRFENVDFRFADADACTLENISFCCRRGETTAVIGGTGSGKSTIAKLLLRYYDVTGGSVCLYGKNIRDLSQNELRSHISYVPQKAWLFSGTVSDNLRYGKADAAEEEMIHALKIAQSDFVLETPDGLKAPVAQGGSNFSGGQKQRLSIARALVKKADLYVFDDSFSALDFKTDAALRHALKEEVRDAAVLIIAQRVSTIQHADQILVLDDGKIAGIGTHQELIKNCPLYRSIVESQTKGGSLGGE